MRIRDTVEKTQNEKKKKWSLTCACLLVLIEFESFVAVAGEDAGCTDADLFTIMFPLGTQVNG